MQKKICNKEEIIWINKYKNKFLITTLFNKFQEKVLEKIWLKKYKISQETHPNLNTEIPIK